MKLRSLLVTLTACGLFALGGSSQAQTFQLMHAWSYRPENPVGALCQGSDGTFYGVSEIGGGASNGFSNHGTVFRVTPAGALTVIHSFRDLEGSLPSSGLVQGTDGFLYGTTAKGGPNDRGTIYKISTAGVFSVLVNLQNTNAGYPRSALIAGLDGNLYGTTSVGGANGLGTVFKVTLAGAFSVVHSFTTATGNGPVHRLVQRSDGNLYGVTYSGGTNGLGTVFRILPNGTTTALHHFSEADGGAPSSALTFGANGNLYGTTTRTFFEVTPQGTLTPLYSFQAASGNAPQGDLVLGSDGLFVGAAIRGSTSGNGTVYRINTTGQFSKLAELANPTNYAGFIESGPGVFLGTTGSSPGLIGSVIKVTAAGALTTLNDLTIVNGTTPSGPLIEAPPGTFFSTTSDSSSGGGTVFRATADGDFSALASTSYFGPVGSITGGVTKGVDGLLYGVSKGASGISALIYKIAPTGGPVTVLAALPYGSQPMGRLVQAPDGNFYGTASDSFGGNGTVFKVTPNGNLTIFASLDGADTGKYPSNTLTLGADGRLYGTTEQGGNNDRGIIFRVTPGATPTFTTLVLFNNTNGQTPTGVLAVGPDGNIYGTTLYGGTNNVGTVFRLTQAGVHSVFANLGTRTISRPRGALAFGSDGSIYGVTSEGGTNNLGSAYRVTAAGVLSVLHSFVSTAPNTPMNGLTLAVDGNLYGTASLGGAVGSGGVFKLTPAGVISHFRPFDYSTGQTPIFSLFRASDERLYGLNREGGTGGGGTLFRMDGRPVITTPAADTLTATSVNLKSSVNPNGSATSVEFTLGTSSAGTVAIGAGTVPSIAQKAITGLSGHTTYAFTATATNVFGAKSTESLTFTTLNRSPAAQDDRFHALLVPIRELAVLGTDSDPDGDPLTISAVTNGTHGTVTTDGAKVFYSPGNGYDGNDSFTYTISDGFGGISTGRVFLENTAPRAVADAMHFRAAPAAINVLSLGVPDSDADGDALTISAVTNGAQGTVTTDGAKVFYTPGAGYQGNDSFTYTISDGFGGTSTATVALSNTAPSAVADAVHFRATPAAINVLVLGTADNDTDGDALTISAVTSGARGTVTTDGATVFYTPGAGYNGNDSFTYTISDGFGGTSTATVALINGAPVAVADEVHVPAASTELQVLLLGTADSDPDGDAVTISAVTDGAKGTVTTDGARIIYRPAPGYDGNDSFTYTISDGFGGTASALVRLKNAVPVAHDDVLHPALGLIEISALSLGTPDADADGDGLTITAVTNGAHGTVTTDGVKAFYTPGATYDGNDQFTYTIADGFGGSSTAAVSLQNRFVSLNPIRVHPAPGPVVVEALGLGPSTLDPDGDALVLSAVTDGIAGTAAIAGTTLLYTPGSGYDGNDAFTYTISDGHGGRSSQTITLHNALPAPSPDLLVTNGEGLTFDPRANDGDADGDALQVTAVTQGRVGGATIDADGTVSYAPGPAFFGRDTFAYTVSDGNGSRVGTVAVRNSDPIALPGAVQGAQVPGDAEGTAYANFSAPGTVSFQGKVRAEIGGKITAIFAADGTVRLSIDQPAPGIAGAFIASLGEPSGQAVIATLRGPSVRPENNTVLYGGLDAGLWIAARKGDFVEQAARLQRFVSIDGNGPTIFFLAQLHGPGVTAANDRALLAAEDSNGFRLLVREGELIAQRQIKTLASLVAAPLTGAEARWRAGSSKFGVMLGFADRGQAIYTIPATAASPAAWQLWASTGDAFPDAGGAMVERLGLPGFGPDGIAGLAQLRTDAVTGVTQANDTIVFRATDAGRVIVARKDGSVPDADGLALPGLTFAKFFDPVAGREGQLAFAGTIKGPGTNAGNKSGLWARDAGGTLRLLARSGDLAPGGGRWAAFKSLVLPDGPESAPIFTATLVPSVSDLITRRNNFGLWATGSDGILRLLLRTGQAMIGSTAPGTIEKFTALAPARGSLGAANGYDHELHVAVLATLTGGKQAVVNIAIP